jgi:hypothetical protein
MNIVFPIVSRYIYIHTLLSYDILIKSEWANISLWLFIDLVLPFPSVTFLRGRGHTAHHHQALPRTNQVLRDDLATWRHPQVLSQHQIYKEAYRIPLLWSIMTDWKTHILYDLLFDHYRLLEILYDIINIIQMISLISSLFLYRNPREKLPKKSFGIYDLGLSFFSLLS